MKKLPVIATRGVIVFPAHSSELNVGRKISLNAIDVARKSYDNKLITVSQKNEMNDKITSKNQLFNVGTLVEFDITKEFENGTREILIKGLDRVKLETLSTNNGQMLESSYEILKSISASQKVERVFIKDLSKILDKTLGTIITIPKNVLTSLASGVSANELSDVIAHYLPLELPKKQKLLETLDVTKRLELISKMIPRETYASKIEKGIDDSVKKTIDSQHKEFLLRERMKAIKQELGEISSKDSEIEKWNQEIDSKKFPNEIKEQVKSEIKRYESTPQMAAESNIIKGYLDWIFTLPWQTYSKDNNNLSGAGKILNKHHYGLKEVKERIIEHLAVKINTKSKTSPIITFVGPPGVGKTSLARSIAEAIGRKFVKVSLGGVKDESEIRGHRRTYVGAMPGKIIQAIKKAKTSNPVILLDEIDKMSSDFKGDPTSAMLEVLDPEQNKHFQDHYLEIEYDLSNIMFLATANFLEQIPGPLIDRVEIISLNQYTSEEKLAIAKDHIIPKVLVDHGLSKSKFQISDKVLEFIIDKYTLESGVRGLNRVLSKLARKIVVMKLNNEIKGSFKITEEKARKLLGKEQVYKEKLKGRAEIGIANGMYYSPHGGGVLPIEVTTYPSKDGGIKLTGSIQEVMKESLKIAIGYIRSNSQKFGIKNFNWDTTMIQVHVPSGATPKDGPSAGIAFATAVISALIKKPVSKEFALTGEITLIGKVLPIGGLKEKTLGAVEAGVRKIIIPIVNKKDYDDLAKKVKEKAKIIPVNNYDEVFNQIFPS